MRQLSILIAKDPNVLIREIGGFCWCFCESDLSGKASHECAAPAGFGEGSKLTCDDIFGKAGLRSL